MKFKSTIRELLRSFGVERMPKLTSEFKQAISRLHAESVVLEFGANIGVYTEILAKTGASVEAYEPDPTAFELLRRRVRGFENVKLHASAVSDRSGVSTLYRHSQFDDDPVLKSQSSSMLSSKHNVSPESGIEISCVDIEEIFCSFEHIDLMKMDIEGFEIPVLNRLLDTGLADRVSMGFIEVHDRKDPSLERDTALLRKRFEQMNLNQYNFDWH
jgi:FkbM family methyltransferase